MHFKLKIALVLLLLLANALFFGCLSQYRFSTQEEGIAFNSDYQPIKQVIYSYRDLKSINVVGELSNEDSSDVMNTALLVQQVFIANNVSVNVIFKSINKENENLDYCLSLDQNSKLNSSECVSLINERFAVIIKTPSSAFDNSVLLEKNKVTLNAKNSSSLMNSAMLLLRSVFPNTQQALADIKRNVASKQTGVFN